MIESQNEPREIVSTFCMRVNYDCFILHLLFMTRSVFDVLQTKYHSEAIQFDSLLRRHILRYRGFGKLIDQSQSPMYAKYDIVIRSPVQLTLSIISLPYRHFISVGIHHNYLRFHQCRATDT